MSTRDFIMKFINSKLFEVKLSQGFSKAYIIPECCNKKFPVYFEEPGGVLNLGSIYTEMMIVNANNGNTIYFEDIDGVFYVDAFEDVYFQDNPVTAVILKVKK